MCLVAYQYINIIQIGTHVAVEVLKLHLASWTDNLPQRFSERLGPSRVVGVVTALQQFRHQIQRDYRLTSARTAMHDDHFLAPVVKPSGVVLINSSLISMGAGRNDIDEFSIPVTEIAKELGSVKVANIVALGAFVARSKIVDFESLRKTVKEEFAGKEKFIPLNMAALDRGKKMALEGAPSNIPRSL